MPRISKCSGGLEYISKRNLRTSRALFLFVFGTCLPEYGRDQEGVGVECLLSNFAASSRFSTFPYPLLSLTVVLIRIERKLSIIKLQYTKTHSYTRAHTFFCQYNMYIYYCSACCYIITCLYINSRCIHYNIINVSYHTDLC